MISFKYDAFGRRIEKKNARATTHFVWDGNVLLHEWKTFDYRETTDNDRITWVFQDFVPVAKLQGGKSYSIISDHLGTPILAIDTNGVKVWERELDIYGKVRNLQGDKWFIPFLYQGQYYDNEVDLCYNRFRYYSPDTGTYISQDPIGLKGRNPNIYAYVWDTNTWVDIFGLDCSQEILRNVNSLMGRKKEEIQKQLQEQGFSKTEARNGGEIWIKAGDDGKTVAIRLDPASGNEGFVDNVPHAHKEIVLSDKIVNGNYKQKNAKTFDDLGNQTSKTDWEANHIPIIE